MDVGKAVREQSHGRQSLAVRIGVVALATVVLGATAIALALALYPRRIAPGVKVGGVEVGLLSEAAAKEKLRAWWTERSSGRLVLKGPSEDAALVSTTPAALGVSLDADRTVSRLPHDDLRMWFGRTVGGSRRARGSYRMSFDFGSLDTKWLDEVVAKTSPKLSPAKATLDANGAVVRTPEVSSMSLVRAETERALAEAIVTGETAHVAAVFGEKRVSDDVLGQIKEVVSTFSTKFSSADTTRSKNLHVAATKLDGAVVLPGERFSFNEFIGERTPENGFFKAGVYRKGKHDIDFGGGVCQVSTTLWNAAVLANMKIEERNNHTFLVPYVPAGRDAAVAYGEYDMVFVNTMETPVAISAKWQPGKLTFSILGVKEPGLEVRLEPRVTQRWQHPVQFVQDPTLPPGTEKEIEKGGDGYRAVTTKVVLRNGVEVSRSVLCRSYYKGGPQIFAIGPAKDEPTMLPGS